MYEAHDEFCDWVAAPEADAGAWRVPRKWAPDEWQKPRHSARILVFPMEIASQLEPDEQRSRLRKNREVAELIASWENEDSGREAEYWSELERQLELERRGS